MRRFLPDFGFIAKLVIVLVACGSAVGSAMGAEDGDGKDEQRDLASRRLEIMAGRIKGIAVSSLDDTVPRGLHPTPLFRYDDETRGYVDGTIWRLGEKGRPLAIITAELHPNYLNGGPRVVYDFLSLTESRFTARSSDVGWSPQGSAVAMQPLADAPPPAAEPLRRLTQLKHQARRFTGTQEVRELDETSVKLRLLPKEIDRYAPDSHEWADGAIFLLVNGRNPALLLLIETDGKAWRYGVGRLSAPSVLELRLDDAVVWSQGRIDSFDWSLPYTASNSAAVFP